MHRGERVCRSVLFWQKTVRRGSRSGAPRPVAVRHGTDAGKGEGAGREERGGTKGTPRGGGRGVQEERRGGLARRRRREEGREKGRAAKGRRGSRSGATRPIAVRHGTDAHRPNAGGPRCNQAPISGEAPTCGHLLPANPRRPPITSQTLHRRPIIGPTFPQPPRRPNPHRQPPSAPHHWRQPYAPPAARHSLGCPLCNQAPTSGEVTTCGHLLPANLRRPPVTDTTPSPSATQLLRRLNPRQPPVTDTTPPLPLPQSPPSAATTLPSAAPRALHQTAGKKEAPPQGGA